MVKRILVSVLVLLSWGLVFGQEGQDPNATSGEGVAVTVYNNNFGVVRQRRTISFEAGMNRVDFTDVATRIDPTSVGFKCISSPGAVSIHEQNYEYDLVDMFSLLRRYVDKEVDVVVRGTGADGSKNITGVLAGFQGMSLILMDENGIRLIDQGVVEQIQLSEKPADLVTRPTLVWLAEATKAGEEICEVSYTTEDMNWHADYLAVLGEGDSSLDFSGWVTVDNRSGAGYENAKLKLVAGDVRREVERPRMMMKETMAMDMAAGAPFEEKAFMEYHLYTLARATTVKNNEIKQIEFIKPASDVPVNKVYLYERAKFEDKVQVTLEFENLSESGLGIPLPAGRIRVFKEDPADGSLEFVGEDRIDHTPTKEKLSLYIGNAFDIAVEHTVIDSRREGREERSTHRIEFRNRKNEPVTILADETFGAHVNWEIEEASTRWEKKDANTARFTIKAATDSTVTLEYRVVQRW